MATIDNLDIQISASTESASKAISNLVSNLGVLEQALGKINAKTYAKQMEQFAASIKKVDEAAKSSGNGMGAIANQAGKVSSSLKTMPSAINLFSSSLGRATKQTRSLSSVFGSLYANFFWIRRLFQKGLGAIEIASDLTEVQNVVDVTFGKMNYMLDDFANTSRQQFGISELAAKRYASQFQAMFTAMDISSGQVKAVNDRLRESETASYAASKGYKFTADSVQEMSLNLTKLAADMGSFFNQESSDVAKRLQAGVVSGQSRALRQYGLDLTMATLQTWANKRGIDAQVDSMTQAEKTMLRYQYVMENMAMAQGDFARTSQTWANQVRLLKQNFQALGAVIGKALIGWIKPAIISINNAMNTIIKLVEAAVNAIGKLMGWQVEISGIGAGVGDDIEEMGVGLDDAAAGAEDTAGGLGKANKAAKELKKTILGFDELNVLNGADKSGSDSGSGGGAGGIGDVSGGAASMLGNVTGGKLTRYKSDINSWWELGRKVGQALYDALDSIDWDKAYSKARNFGKNLADFLNGLINPKLFDKVGESIAKALNTALYFLEEFGTTFNWKKFGMSLAAGVNGFFKNFDFDTLAKNINIWSHGILDTIIAYLDKTDWDMIGRKFGKLLLDIDFAGIGKKIGKAIWKAINAGFKVFDRMFDTAPLETALAGLAGAFVVLPNLIKPILGLGISKFFTNAYDSVKKFTGAIGKPLLAGFNTMNDTVRAGGGYIAGIGKGFDTAGKNLSTFTKVALTIGSVVGEFAIVSSAVNDIATGTGNLGLNIAEIVGALGVAATALSVVFTPTIGIAVAAVTGFTAAIVGIDEAVQASNMDKILENIRTEGEITTQAIDDYFNRSINSITDGNAKIKEELDSLASQRQGIAELTVGIEGIGLAMEADASIISQAAPEVIKQYQELTAAINNYIDESTKSLIANILAQRDELEARGTDVGAMIARVLQAQGDIKTANDEWMDALVNAGNALDGSKEKNEEFLKVFNDMPESYQNVVKATDEFSTSMSDLTTATIESVEDLKKSFDFSDYGGNLEWLAADMEESLNNAIQVGDTKLEELNSVWESRQQELKAQLTAGELTQDDYNDLYAVNEQKYEQTKKNIGNAVMDVARFYESTIAEEAAKVTEEAGNAWSEDKLKKLFGIDKESYMKGELKSYGDRVLLGEDGLLGTIQAAYGQFGSGAEPYIEKAWNDLNGLFEKKSVDSIPEMANAVEDTVFKGGEEGFQNGIERIKDEARANISFTDIGEEFGEQTPIGYAEGIRNKIDESKRAVKEWMSEVKKNIHDSDMNFGSPSITAWEFGRDTVLGYKEGIEKNDSISIDTVARWLSDVSKKMLGDLTTLGKDALKNVQDGLGNVSNEAKSKVADMQAKMSEGFGKIKTMTSDVFEGVSKTIGEKIESAKSIVSSGISAIEGFFSNMKLSFPEITMPHFELGTQTKQILGRDIILPKIDVQWYAQGGFPEDGLFFANHHELVGQFSNGKTAVANNSQIIEGIQGGVTRAIVQYLPEIIRDAVSAADTGGGDVYIGDEQIARAATRGQRKIDKRYNTAIQF